MLYRSMVCNPENYFCLLRYVKQLITVLHCITYERLMPYSCSM